MRVVEKDGSVIFVVRVVPRASKSEIVGEYEDALKVKLISPPVDGAANAELIKLLAKRLGVSKSAIEISSGRTSKSKTITIHGITRREFERRLGEIL